MFSDLSHLTPLCGLTKILRFAWPMDGTYTSAVLSCFEQSQLHTLAISSFPLGCLSGQMIRQYFSKFPCTSVTTLALHDIHPTNRALLVFLSLFPNVDNLSISVNHWIHRSGSALVGNDDDEIILRTCPPRFRGSFKFFDPPGGAVWGCQRGKLLRTIAVFPLQFQTVSLAIADQYWQDTWCFLDSCSKSAKKVFVKLGCGEYQTRVPCTRPGAQGINALVACPFIWTSIDFPNLEELRVDMSSGSLGVEYHSLLWSITSPCLRRMIIEIEAEAHRFEVLDLDLSRMADRNNAHGNFTLQISTTLDPGYIRQLFPLVAQQGVLEVCYSERPDYCK